MNLNKFEQIYFIIFTRLTKNKEAKNTVKFLKKVFLGENNLWKKYSENIKNIRERIKIFLLKDKLLMDIFL